jgi:hypothetical protein
MVSISPWNGHENWIYMAFSTKLNKPHPNYQI